VEGTSTKRMLCLGQTAKTLLQPRSTAQSVGELITTPQNANWELIDAFGGATQTM